MIPYCVGIDLGSTTTKAVTLGEENQILGRGITNSRSNYDVACQVDAEQVRVQVFGRERGGQLGKQRERGPAVPGRGLVPDRQLERDPLRELNRESPPADAGREGRIDRGHED